MSITQFKNTATLALEESNPVAVPSARQWL